MIKKWMAQQNISRKIGSALSALAYVTTVLLCIFVVMQVYTQGYVNIAGFSVFRVVTGSMEPSIPVGSLLLSQEVPISQIQERDVVCFVSREEATRGKVITHRVVAIHKADNGIIVLETKGDANLVADGYFVTSENLVGRVSWHTKEGNIMAGFMSFLSSQMGFLICVLFPILLIAGFILRSCVRNIRKEMDTVLHDLEPKEQETSQEESIEQMKERIRKELLDEIGQGVQSDEGREEFKTTE